MSTTGLRCLPGGRTDVLGDKETAVVGVHELCVLLDEHGIELILTPHMEKPETAWEYWDDYHEFHLRSDHAVEELGWCYDLVRERLLSGKWTSREPKLSGDAWRERWAAACQRVFGDSTPPDHQETPRFVRLERTGRTHLVGMTNVSWDRRGSDALRLETACGHWLDEPDLLAVGFAEAPFCERCAKRLI